MGSIVVSAVIDKAATVLFDVNNVKWGRSELLKWFNDAQRALVSLVPEASAVTANLQLTSGARQSLPSGANQLLEVVRNMGTNGSTAGRMVKRVDRAVFDETNPTWYSDSSNVVTTMYMYNLRDRSKFYVYPPSPGTNYLEIIYSATPTELAENATITVDDIWVPALLDYMLWRAHSKDANFADANKAQTYFQSYSMYVKGQAADAAKLASEMGQVATVTSQGQGSGG